MCQGGAFAEVLRCAQDDGKRAEMMLRSFAALRMTEKGPEMMLRSFAALRMTEKGPR